MIALTLSVLHIQEAVGDGRIRLVELALSGGSGHRQRASVEGVQRGDHLIGTVQMELAMAACQLHRALVGLGAAVAEKNLVEAAILHKQLSEL